MFWYTQQLTGYRQLDNCREHHDTESNGCTEHCWRGEGFWMDSEQTIPSSMLHHVTSPAPPPRRKQPLLPTIRQRTTSVTKRESLCLAPTSFPPPLQGVFPTMSKHNCGNKLLAPIWSLKIITTIKSRAVTVYDSPKILRSAHTVYLCVLNGSENKQRLFPYTALTDWFV